MRNVKHIRWLVPIVVFATAVVSGLLIHEGATASDPIPVNPPEPIPLFLVDSEGRSYEVFTPEEGGSVVGDDYSLIAEPGDVPSAVIVGIRMSKGGEASNAGMAHHRYTLGGDYHVIDAIDANGKAVSPWFRFRNPPVACVPMPSMFLANLDSVALIATDEAGVQQTVLNSGAYAVDLERVVLTSEGEDGVSRTTLNPGGSAGVRGLQVCGYVGTVPAILAVGLEGAPGPLPPTPVVEVQIVELPVTGGAAPSVGVLAALLILGVVLIGLGVAAHFRQVRRSEISSSILSSSSPS